MKPNRKKTLILGHSDGASAHSNVYVSWRFVRQAIFEWGVYCGRLGVKPDKPRIRLYHG